MQIPAIGERTVKDSKDSKDFWDEKGREINQGMTHYGTKNCFNYGIKVFNY